MACLQSLFTVFGLYCAWLSFGRNWAVFVVMLAWAVAWAFWPAGTLRSRAALRRVWRSGSLTIAVLKDRVQEFEGGRTFGRSYTYGVEVAGRACKITYGGKLTPGRAFPAVVHSNWMAIIIEDSLVPFRLRVR